jgi:hypothetical protein
LDTNTGGSDNEHAGICSCPGFIALGEMEFRFRFHVIFAKYFNWENELSALSLVEPANHVHSYIFYRLNGIPGWPSMLNFFRRDDWNGAWEKDLLRFWCFFWYKTGLAIFWIFFRPLERKIF